MKSASDITSCAKALLDLDPDPVPRFCILRDVLRKPADDPVLQEAKERMLQSRWISELAAEQLPHGGWARFHSMDSRSDHKIPTTEFGVQRAVHLGLEDRDAILARARRYLVALLNKQLPWPEHKERNDLWATGEEMFIASTLAWIDPGNPVLQDVYAKWREIAEQAFASGRYDPEAEWQAHYRLTGATMMRGSYLVLRNRHAVHLLSKTQNRLQDRTEVALMDWLWAQPRGLGYVDVPLSRPFPTLSPSQLGRWFFSQTILSGFRCWTNRARQIADELWAARHEDGLWDFGPKVGGEVFRLSENWRKKGNRMIDHSVIALLLLSQCHDRT